ncbi:MAG: universal stress protein [Burkholderiales bacterium]
MPLNTILAATDFSAAAQQAMDRAAQIAKISGAQRLALVHIVSRVSLKSIHRLLSAAAEQVRPRLIEEVQVTLRHAAEDLARRHGIMVESYVGVGNLSAEVNAFADEIGASLLVVGARGTSTMRDLVVGTTAENVLRRTRRPLLIVKQPPTGPYHKLLVATDFSPHSSSALEFAHGIAADADLIVLHAYEVPFESKLRYAGIAEDTVQQYRTEARQEAESRGRDFLRNSGIIASTAFIHGYPPAVIRDYEKQARPDLIAVGKHGQSEIEELLLGSVSEHVLANASCDVLIVGEGSKARSD